MIVNARRNTVAATIVTIALLLPLAVIITYHDVRYRRIPNAYVLAALVGGVAINGIFGGLSGLLTSLGGCALAFGLMFMLHVFGAMGAGDVKLFAAASCWLAPSQIFGAALVSALAGGVLSVIGLVLAHGLGLTTLRIAHGLRDPKILATPLAVPAGRKTLPYGLAMTVGLLIAAWFPRWLQLG
jgi:prepilin peptidase CpaA